MSFKKNIQKKLKKHKFLASIIIYFQIRNNSVSFIYNEHFIEHLNIEKGIKFLKDSFRLLKPGGVIRVATPDLDYIIQDYITDKWKKRKWLKKYGYEQIKTKAEMINIAFRDWGHQYLYNEEELERRIYDAGFKNVYRQNINESKYMELRNRETREESRLILEAIKK